MSGLRCNACNKNLQDVAETKLHYRSDWHRYNLKRKVDCVPGVTEALFIAWQSTLAEETNMLSQRHKSFSCVPCCKTFKSLKAHEQHLKSRAHIARTFQRPCDPSEDSAIVNPLKHNEECEFHLRTDDLENGDSGDEWVEVDSDDSIGVNHDIDEIDPSCCFMCDQNHSSLESCMVHLHKQHGFFIPDIDYLKDPHGLLTYLGLKVRRDFACLYCNQSRLPFTCLEAVRKHMEAKSHCKVHYGDADDEDEGELEDFYDYSSSYVGVTENEVVGDDNIGSNTVELESAGSELIITTRMGEGISTKTLGSREYLRYYRQNPRPSLPDNVATAAVAARSMGLVETRERKARMKVLKVMNRSGLETMRTQIGLKNNIIRNLPKNVPY